MFTELSLSHDVAGLLVISSPPLPLQFSCPDKQIIVTPESAMLVTDLYTDSVSNY